MTNTAKLVGAAAAVGVAAYLGYAYFIAPNGSGAPEATADPTPSSTVTAGPVQNLAYERGALAPGTYFIGNIDPFQIKFTVPVGWEKLPVRHMVWSEDDDKSTVGFLNLSHIAYHACHPSLGVHDVGPTVDDLVTELGDMQGFEINSSTEVTIGGHAGTMLDISLSDPPCAGGVEPLLGYTQPGDMDQPHPGGSDSLFDRWYIIDVNGERLVIATAAARGATEQRLQDIQAIVDSIEIALDRGLRP
jgi:hypothetical protein